MDKIKCSIPFKIISAVLILTFITLDISYAYPPEHGTGSSTLATPLWSQSARDRAPIIGEGAIVASVFDIGEYFFGRAEAPIPSLPTGYAADVVKAGLGKVLGDSGIEISNIVPVEYLKATAPGKLRAALDDIGFKRDLPNESVILVLYRKNGKRFLVQIARVGEVSPESLPGYEWPVSGKYLVKYIPSDYGSEGAPVNGSGVGNAGRPGFSLIAGGSEQSGFSEKSPGQAAPLSADERVIIDAEGQAIFDFLAAHEAYDVASGTWTGIPDEEALLASGPFDVMVVLGSSDERVPKEAARLAKELLARNPGTKVVTSGKYGKNTYGMAGQYFGRSGRQVAESVHYARVMKALGVKTDIVEPRSTNSGENIRYSRNRIIAAGLKPARIVVFQTPLLQLRAGRSLERQYPLPDETLASMGVKSVTSYSPYRLRLSALTDKEALSVIKAALRELANCISYGKEGRFMPEVKLPPEVGRAKDALEKLMAARAGDKPGEQGARENGSPLTAEALANLARAALVSRGSLDKFERMIERTDYMAQRDARAELRDELSDQRMAGLKASGVGARDDLQRLIGMRTMFDKEMGLAQEREHRKAAAEGRDFLAGPSKRAIGYSAVKAITEPEGLQGTIDRLVIKEVRCRAKEGRLTNGAVKEYLAAVQTGVDEYLDDRITDGDIRVLSQELTGEEIAAICRLVEEDVAKQKTLASGQLTIAYDILTKAGCGELVEMLRDLYSNVMPYLVKSQDESPVHHTAYVIRFAAEIAVAEMRRGAIGNDDVKALMVAALFHDSGIGYQTIRKIVESEFKGLGPDAAVPLMKMAVRAREQHMKAAVDVFDLFFGKPREPAARERWIDRARILIATHDNAKIPLLRSKVNDICKTPDAEFGPEYLIQTTSSRLDESDPENVDWLVQLHLEADSLWMVCNVGIDEDIARAVRNKSKNVKTRLEQLEHNSNQHRYVGQVVYGRAITQRKLASGDYGFRDGYLYRSEKGYELFRSESAKVEERGMAEAGSKFGEARGSKPAEQSAGWPAKSSGLRGRPEALPRESKGLTVDGLQLRAEPALRAGEASPKGTVDGSQKRSVLLNAKTLAAALAVALVPALALAGEDLPVSATANGFISSHPVFAGICMAAAGIIIVRAVWRNRYPVSWHLFRIKYIDIDGSSAEALVKLGAPAVPDLIKALGGSNPRLREGAATALGKIGDPRAIMPLITVLGDDDSWFSSISAGALGKIGAPAIGPLIETLKNKDPNVRSGAVVALNNIGDPAFEPLVSSVKEALSDRAGAADETLIKTAIRALRAIGMTVKDDLRKIELEKANMDFRGLLYIVFRADFDEAQAAVNRHYEGSSTVSSNDEPGYAGLAAAGEVEERVSKGFDYDKELAAYLSRTEAKIRSLQEKIARIDSLIRDPRTVAILEKGLGDSDARDRRNNEEALKEARGALSKTLAAALAVALVPALALAGDSAAAQPAAMSLLTATKGFVFEYPAIAIAVTVCMGVIALFAASRLRSPKISLSFKQDGSGPGEIWPALKTALHDIRDRMKQRSKQRKAFVGGVVEAIYEKSPLNDLELLGRANDDRKALFRLAKRLKDIADETNNVTLRSRAYLLIGYILSQYSYFGIAAKISKKYIRLALETMIEATRRSVDIPSGRLAIPSELRDCDIVIDCPVRVDLSHGGASDLFAMTYERGGRAVNIAMDLNGKPPIKIKLRRLHSPVISLVSKDLGARKTIESKEEILDYNDRSDPLRLFKAAFKIAGIVQENDQRPLKEILEEMGGGIELEVESDVPKGSGLGTSSILGVGVMEGLYRISGQKKTKDEVVNAGLYLEQTLGVGGGWQDSVGGMFGGVKEIASKPGKPQPVSRAIKASPDFIKELEERLVLFYTGKSHFAGDILTKLTIDFISKSRVERESRERLSLMDRDIIGAIERGDVDALGALITDFWKEWKILNPEASNDDVEALFAGIKDLVSGGKLCGAGGGGFAMFIAQKGRRGDVENRLREMYPDADERIYRGTVNKDGVSMTLYASSDTRLLDSYLNHVVYEKILIEATAGTIGRGGEISGAVLEGLATAVGEGVSLAITGDMANKLNSELKKRISSGSGSGRITVYGGDLSARELNAFGWKTRVAAIMDGSISKSRYKAEGYGCFSVTGASPANSHAVSMPLVDGLQLKGADATEWLLQHLVTKPAVDRLCDQISTLKEGQLVIFSGFSGTGKGTLFDLLSSVYGDKMTKVLLYTTRDMRKGEKQDREYHFVSPEEFERTRKDKDMVSVSIHGPGKMYGVRIDDIEKAMAEGQIVFVEVGHEMGKALRERYPKAASIFMIPTDDALEGIRSELRFRLKVRASENEDGIASRLRTAETEDIARHGYGNNIVNERWGLYGAAAAFVSLVNENASALRAARMTEAPGDLFDEANIRRNQPAARKLATALAVALVPALALAGDGGASVLSAAKEAMFAHPYVAALGCAVIGLVAARFIWMRFYPVSWYMRELRTADPALKFKAADKLGRICAIEDVPVLVEAMDDRGWFVRLTAANILDDIGWKPSDAEERIAYLIAHQKWDLVARSGIQAYAMLLRRLDDADSGFLSGAIWALGRTGGAMAAKPLIRLVNEGNLDVRGYAAETLADLGEPAVKPVIEAVMEEHSDIALIGVLKDIGLPAVDPLIEELRGDERSRKERAAYALGEVRKNVDAAARSRIDEAVGSYKPEEQSAAALFDLVESADVSKDSPIAPLVYMARKAKREDQKLIIGLETDWIPAMDNRRSLQSAAIASLMKEIQSIGETLASMGLNNVEIVRSDSHALANAVIKAAVRAKTDMRNVIIIASSDTIYSDSFTILRNTRGGDRPFMAAIDPQELVRAYEKLGEATGSQLHITLKDLLYITVALAAGKEPPKTPLIVTYDKNMRFVIFMPKAEPMDYERLRDTYKAEAVALAAA